MLSIGGDDLAKSTIFWYWGGWFSKIDTSVDVQLFAHNEVKTKKTGHNVPRCPIFCPKWSEDQKKVITFADAQFWNMKMLGGGCCRIIGGDTSLHGFAPMVMKRFEIIEKLCLSKALLKMAGEGCRKLWVSNGVISIKRLQESTAMTITFLHSAHKLLEDCSLSANFNVNREIDKKQALITFRSR